MSTAREKTGLAGRGVPPEWADVLAKGKRPLLSRNRHDKRFFAVWGYDTNKEKAESEETKSEDEKNGEEKKSTKEESPPIRRRFRLVQFCDLRPGLAEQPNRLTS